MYLSLPLREFPLKFCNVGKLKKLVISVPEGGKKLTIVDSFRYNTIV